jgi:hypothetical protein
MADIDIDPRPTVLVADSGNESSPPVHKDRDDASDSNKDESMDDASSSSDHDDQYEPMNDNDNDSISTQSTAGMQEHMADALKTVGLDPSFIPSKGPRAALTQDDDVDPYETQMTEPAMPISIHRPNFGGIPAEPPKGILTPAGK